METLRGEVADIGRLQQRLARNEARLEGLIVKIEARPDNMDCVAKARRVLLKVFGEAKSLSAYCGLTASNTLHERRVTGGPR